MPRAREAARELARRVGEELGPAGLPLRRAVAGPRSGVLPQGRPSPSFRAESTRASSSPITAPPDSTRAPGGVLVGARRPLIAFNVNLRGELEAAQAVAAVVREAGGGFPGVRALGLDLPSAGLVQVSMNVEDWEAAALHEIVAAGRRGGARAGCRGRGLGARRADARRRGRSRRRRDAQDRRFRLLPGARAAPARALSARPARPASGIATAAAAKTVSGAVSAKRGETNNRPVAWAPRWTSDYEPCHAPEEPVGHLLLGGRVDEHPGRALSDAGQESSAASAMPSVPAIAKSPYAGR